MIAVLVGVGEVNIGTDRDWNGGWHRDHYGDALAHCRNQSSRLPAKTTTGFSKSFL